jgi:Tol biopolymer transport system component
MPVAGGVARLLVPAQPGKNGEDLNWPAYSADGQRITFNRYVPELDTIQLWTAAADGTGLRRFNADDPVFRWEGEGVPSPDGRWIAAWRVTASGGSQIVLLAADGSGPARVLEEQAGTARWIFSPDSRHLLVYPADGGPGHLLDIAGGPSTPVPWGGEPDWQRTAP